ncbi:MAG TPA: SCO family protein [Azospirillaceae bacterium]|nr:SCO family protein [Azospirillaceae bacterium]
MNRRFARMALAALIGLAIAAVVAWNQLSHLPPGGTITTTANIGGPYSLVDHTGKPVTGDTYAGKLQLVYFGYTFCPDVCPTELSTMAQALDRLGADADKIQPLFITIDPQRDTVTQLAAYTPLFHPQMIGLTGSPEQVAAAARAFRVYYAKAKTDESGHYAMDHSSFVYLMGPDGHFLTVFPHGTDPDKMAAEIRARLAG